jgi:hypothetical protein
MAKTTHLDVRASEEDRAILARLAEHLGISKTAAMWQSVRALARKEGITMAKSYVVLDEHNQLAPGPDWHEVEADGKARLQAELARQQAEAEAVREWDRTHDETTGEAI